MGAGGAPLLAGLAVSLSGPGGRIEALRESRAALKTVLEAERERSFGEFLQSVADDVAAKARRRENPLAGFAPDRRRVHEAILGYEKTIYEGYRFDAQQEKWLGDALDNDHDVAE